MSDSSRVIYVDVNEDKLLGSIEDELNHLGITTERRKLLSGDYVLGEIGIEHKKVNDLFCSSTAKTGGRLWNQLFELRRNFKKPFLMITGSLGDLNQINYDYDRLTLRVMLSYGIPVIKRNSIKETAKTIDYIYRVSGTIGQGFKIQEKKKITLKEVMMDLLARVPSIGMGTAQYIINETPIELSLALTTPFTQDRFPKMTKKQRQMLCEVFHSSVPDRNKNVGDTGYCSICQS